MGLRYLGNINKPGYNPLASNITTGVNVVQYQGIFTTQQQLQAITTGQWVTDPVFDYSTLLLQADGIANGSQNNTFLDSSTNNFTITRNGNTTQGTFTPFSATGWGNYFGGSDYLSAASNAAFQLGTGDWTVEYFVFPISFSNSPSMVDTRVLSAGNGYSDYFNTSGKYLLFWNNANQYTSTATFVTNTWYHIAVCRASGTVSVYINGRRDGTFSDSTNLSDSNLRIANNQGASNGLTGYLSSVRIVKGTAVYSGSTITVPTSALTNITNTSLLTCQSNRFVDNSSNAFALTVTGTPSVQAFSPFAPQFQYTASGTGGSGYFDGSGDYLTAGSASDWTFLHNGSDWTIQFSIYHTTSSTVAILNTTPTSSQVGMFVYINDGVANGISVGFNRGAVGTGISFNSNAALKLNQWNIVSITFTSSTKTCAFYINGAAEGSSSNTGFAYSSSNPTNTLTIGAAANTPTLALYVGYLSSLRVSTNVRTGLTTLPTTPYTNDANTKLLCNFTNAGILDGTMKNNLETVGNASVSTSVVKYGSGSLYFDGNGDALLIRPDAPLPLFVRTADFTVEAWIYLSSTSVANYMLWGNNGPDIQFYVNTSAKLVLAIGAVGGPTGSINIPTNTWVHVAATRTAGYINLFVNGVFDTRSTTGGTSNLNNSKYYVGTDLTSYFNGYIDDMRFTLGVARYITSFTPPTVALPRQ